MNLISVPLTLAITLMVEPSSVTLKSAGTAVFPRTVKAFVVRASVTSLTVSSPPPFFRIESEPVTKSHVVPEARVNALTVVAPSANRTAPALMASAPSVLVAPLNTSRPVPVLVTF